MSIIVIDPRSSGIKFGGLLIFNFFLQVPLFLELSYDLNLN